MAHLHRLKFHTVRAYMRFRKYLASTFSLAGQAMLDTRVFKGFGVTFSPAACSEVFCRGDYKNAQRVPPENSYLFSGGAKHARKVPVLMDIRILPGTCRTGNNRIYTVWTVYV